MKLFGFEIKRAAKEVLAKASATKTVSKVKAKVEKVVKEKSKKKEVKKSANAITNFFFLNSVNKNLHSFYSTKNFSKVLALLEADKKLLASSEFAPTIADSRISLLRGQADPASAGLAQKLSGLNFFPLLNEIKSQKAVIERFPGKVLKNKVELERHNTLSTQLTSLQAEVQKVYQRKHIEAYYNERISASEKAALTYKSVTKLVK
jgi:hypothetical protein